MTEIIARREFSPLYIILDTIFLLVFMGLLLYKKKYMTVIIGLLAGILYMIVDYGIFHLLLNTRTIYNGYNMFWVLFWMSMSYGFTNFCWIWLWISKDKKLFEWSLLIILWWLCCPLITKTFDTGTIPIIIERTTGSYHGYMAIILFVGYLFLIFWNLIQEKEKRINILWLLIIGILVQFSWEIGLLIGGIRSTGDLTFAQKMLTIVVNSLLETNLGMPYIYFIFLAFNKKYTESLKIKDVKLSFIESLKENNNLKIRV